MTIRLKIFFAVLFVAAAGLIGAIFIGFMGLNAATTKDAIVGKSLAALNLTRSIDALLEETDTAVKGALAMTRLTDMQALATQLDETAENVTEQVTQLQSVSLSPEMDQLTLELIDAKELWIENIRVSLGFTPGKTIPTHELLARNSSELNRLSLSIMDLAQADAVRITQAESLALKDGLYKALGGVVLLIVVALGFALWTGRRIATSAKKIAVQLSSMAGSASDQKTSPRNEISQIRDATIMLENELDMFQTSLRTAALRASEGDLSARVAQTAKQDDLRAIAACLNKVFADVEIATTEASKMLGGLASGDLSVRMEGQFLGVFAELQSNGNTMGTQLATLVGRIQETGCNIQSELEQMRADSNSLSQRASEQAKSLSVISNTLNEMAQTVDKNAENAGLADSLSKESSTVATKGAKIAQGAMDAMQLATHSTSQISHITSSVDDIAFQTQLLSLNASVEAARVGEAGRGFAVVAGEVRSLAMQASDASTEIGQMIKKGQESVNEGHQLVSDTSETLSDLGKSVEKVVAAISQISSASQSQAIDVKDVGVTVRGLEAETHENAALADKSAVAVQNLAEEAQELKALVSFFDVGDSVANRAQSDQAA
ncbi:methyl-accepting chemotaxis protein [Algirhabdus cladophorae]|uniref:methyl-accepting chemotaxis protein n=1 Tax=Algirhabdus cladophorae TaxID=3377108 RepID=UPI003B84560B